MHSFAASMLPTSTQILRSALDDRAEAVTVAQPQSYSHSIVPGGFDVMS